MQKQTVYPAWLHELSAAVKLYIQDTRLKLTALVLMYVNVDSLWLLQQL